jgi:4-hydroxybenzoate polyprenyltransferase
MVQITEKIKAYLRLIRIHSLIVTALTPLLGACATFSFFEGNLIPYDKIPILINLFLVGIIMHIFGEILNDYIDYDIDKTNVELKNKPLVSGIISKKAALTGMVISFLLLIVLIYYAKFNALSLIMLTTAALTGIIYNLISKKWVHSAIFLTAWAPFSILFGAVYAGNFNSLFNVSALAYIIAILGGFHLWMNTAVLGHLKDIKNDSRYGVLTFPMIFGVKVKEEGKKSKLIIPMKFRLMVLIIQAINLFVAFIPIILFSKFYDHTVNIYLLILGLIFLSLMIFASQIKIMWHTLFERKKLMRMMAFREIGTYYLAVVLISPLIGWVLILIFTFLPLVWFLIVNMIFSGNPMEPSI